MAKDNINPNHYKNGEIECIDAIESAVINKSGKEAVPVANIIKYLWRYEDKNGLEDVMKCKWYLERLIKLVEEREQSVGKKTQVVEPPKPAFGILETSDIWSEL